MSLVKKISYLYQFYTNRFICEFVESNDDIQQCLAIRKKVFGEELRRSKDNVEHSPATKDSWDEKSYHVRCRDKKSGKIVGAVRFTPASVLAADPEMRQEYRLFYFDDNELEEAAVASRLTVLKEFRSKPVALALACSIYSMGMQRGYGMALIVCEPNLYPMYKKLGYKPLGKVGCSVFGGYRLPLYLIGDDGDHLKSVRSPLIRLYKKFPPCSNSLSKSWEQRFLKHKFTGQVGFEIVSDRSCVNDESQLYEDLSSDGRTALLKNAIKVSCLKGDVVISKDAGCKNFGIVHAGALAVALNQENDIVLGEGQVFGEVAFLINTPRSADIIAMTDDTEVIFFSLSVVKKLVSVQDQAMFWRNLARIVATRLISKNDF